ncbi:ABC transporter substrate-binding protein [Paenibacillus marchantiophytorum]|uniref:ABC transporter substrate-binding protein n=1 Tax=Paenibacillus marchantiophytorum TaxID=1619310 RepID=A0ABQ1F9C0_9BACL|nr:sugar ABC transporter substrate-binding protein [Paenibacillus marchantiophytorum]GGA04176.1 ABC transporter substrate-binding protein [Paenibacillus marchantiophytorum]
MKRNVVLSTLLGVTMVASLAACGGQTDKPKSTATASAGAGGAKTKLTYWTVDRHDADYMKEVIKKFNETNKDNIEVEMTVLADNFNQSVDIAFASNQAPDILRTNDFPGFVKKGYLQPINDLMTDEMKKRYNNLLVEEMNTMDGSIYSLPNTGQYWRLIYNVDLFKKAGITEPPKTMKELVEDAKKITEAGKDIGAYGFAENFKNPASAFGRIANPIGSLSGTSVVDGYNYKTGQFDFNTYKPIVEALRQMKQEGSMLPGVESLDIDPLRAQFAAGKIGMYFNHSGEPAVYQSQFPTKINWSAALPPTIDGNQRGTVSVIAGNYIGISKSTANKDKAWKFLQYIYNLDFQKEYHEKGYGISIVPDVNAVAKKPTTQGIEGFLPTKFDALYAPTPLNVTDTKVEGIKFGNAIMKYMLEGGDVDKMLTDLTTRYNAGLEKARTAGDTKTKANPSFDPNKLQGSLAK